MAKEWAKWFYNSTAWKDCRQLYIDNVSFGDCEECGEVGEVVHHKDPITKENIHDVDITLNFDNLQHLCSACHKKKHYHMSKAKTKRRYKFNSDGSIKI